MFAKVRTNHHDLNCLLRDSLPSCLATGRLVQAATFLLVLNSVSLLIIIFRAFSPSPSLKICFSCSWLIKKDKPPLSLSRHYFWITFRNINNVAILRFVLALGDRLSRTNRYFLWLHCIVFDSQLWGVGQHIDSNPNSSVCRRYCRTIVW